MKNDVRVLVSKEEMKWTTNDNFSNNSATFISQKGAIQLAKKVAKKNDGELIVKNQDGYVREIYNYGDNKTVIEADGNKIIMGDAFIELKKIKDNSIDLILTDPPYFIEGMGTEWDKEALSGKRFKKTTVGSLPGGMKFDKEQSIKNEQFSRLIGKEYFRVLKPGGFLISFSQARLYHSMTWGFENCGFEIRDMLGWTYEGQAKAFSQDHFVKKLKISEDEKNKLLKNLDGRKTPQLKPNIEPMCLAQKPKEGTYIENWQKWGVGLIDTTNKWEGMFPGNIISCKKPTKKEKGMSNDHLTVKPINLIEHIIKVFSKSGDTILDPFLGSGTTALAAIRAQRKIIGFEINKDYYTTIKERIYEL